MSTNNQRKSRHQVFGGLPPKFIDVETTDLSGSVSALSYLDASEMLLTSVTVESLGMSSATPDFSRATAAVAMETSWPNIDLHQRLAAQLECDAEKIRRSCAIVRDPSKPRTITYAAPNEMMSITRLVCGG